MKIVKFIGFVLLTGFLSGWAADYSADLTNPAGTIIYSSEWSPYTHEQAFDNDYSTLSNLWESNGTVPQYIGYDFGAGNEKTIARYRLHTANDIGWIPNDWQFQGSNNGSSWSDVHTVTGAGLSLNSWSSYYTFSNSTAYRYYRIYVTAVQFDAGSDDYVDIKEIEMMELSSAAITFTDGSAFTPAITLGSSNQVIGRFTLTGDVDGAALTTASIKLNGVRTGLSNFKLWGSTDGTFGGDTQLGSTVAADPGNGNSVSFSGFTSAIGTTGTFYFLTSDVSAGATGLIQGVIVANGNLTMNKGTLTGTITNAPLSNGDISLPVELTLFTATMQKGAIILTWQTESETGNLGFILERAAGNNAWQPVASYKTHPALKGQGNSATTTTYTFTDNTVLVGTEYRYRLGDVNTSGTVTMHSPISVTTTALPQSTAMLNAYPNPFNPETTVKYTLHQDAQVTITVYDLLGRKVKTLVDEQQAAGAYQAVWNGTDAVGAQAASGAYLVRMETAEVTQTQKVLFVK
ncbi:MAG TPA: FlgD immunoglobulin-like domain containing protein [bacterium]|nr:FlgD immunoglobulin-like domain containing protein [bacterium]HPN44685.1 FlgD immunoglobulin-like domain containing protein [bacterium]